MARSGLWEKVFVVLSVALAVAGVAIFFSLRALAPSPERKIFMAIEDGDRDLVQRLLVDGVDPSNGHWYAGYTPLHQAAIHGRLEITRDLLDAGAEPSRVDRNDVTPLHLAAAFGHVEIMKLLIARGARLDTGDHTGETPLYLAAQYGHLDAVECLLDAGGDPKIANQWGQTPLDAARRPSPGGERIYILPDRPASLPTKAKGSVISTSDESGENDITRLITERMSRDARTDAP